MKTSSSLRTLLLSAVLSAVLGAVPAASHAQVSGGINGLLDLDLGGTKLVGSDAADSLTSARHPHAVKDAFDGGDGPDFDGGDGPDFDGGDGPDFDGGDGPDFVKPAGVYVLIQQTLDKAAGQPVKLQDVYDLPGVLDVLGTWGPEGDALRAHLQWLMLVELIVDTSAKK